MNVDGQPYNGTYTLIQGEIEEERTATDGNIVLKGDQKAKVPLPVGSQYEITEADTAVIQRAYLM